jgi:hypothetical protein
MTSLFIALIFMLILALVATQLSFLGMVGASKQQWQASLTVLISTIFIYNWVTPWYDLAHWLKQGKAHYQLLEKIQQLGGLEKIIDKIELHIKTHPEEKEGQKLLEKLKKIP